MQDNKVIEALGNGKDVADALNTLVEGASVTADQVYAWKARNRIPGDWRPWVARLASRQKIQNFDEAAFLVPARKQRDAAA